VRRKKQNIKQMAYARSLEPIIRDLRSQGYSLQAVADTLNAKSIFTSRGTRWSKGTIRQCLLLAEKPLPAFPKEPTAGVSKREIGWVLTAEVAWKHYTEKEEPRDIAFTYNQSLNHVLYLLRSMPGYREEAERHRLDRRKADPDQAHFLYAAGVVQRRIAQILKCNRTAVRNALKKFADYNELTDRVRKNRRPRSVKQVYTPEHLAKQSRIKKGKPHHLTAFERARAARSQRNRQDRDHLEWHGESLTIPGWAERLGMRPATLHNRRRKGWSVAQILTPKLRPNTRSGEHYILWRNDTKKWFVCINRKNYGTFRNLDDAISRRNEVLVALVSPVSKT
jgi:Recombinase